MRLGHKALNQISSYRSIEGLQYIITIPFNYKKMYDSLIPC
jgi:hypothetical protein